MGTKVSDKSVTIIPEEDSGLKGNCYLPKCIAIPFTLEFRPPFPYNGSFCIDWLRDSYKNTSFDYNALVDEYEELEELTTPARKYLIPYLLINVGQTIRLSLKIKIFNFAPKKVTFFVDNENVLTLSEAYKIYPDEDFVDGGGLSNFLSVTCNKEIIKNQYITVKADGVLVGKIKVVPNRIISGPKIVFVNVNFDTSSFNTGEKTLATRIFKQCGINLIVGKDEFSLNLFGSENKFPQNFFHENDIINAYYYPEILEFLDSKFNKLTGASKYEDFQKVYFINKKAMAVTTGGDIKSNDVLGFSKFPPETKRPSVVIFKSGFGGTTLTHELLHSLGIPHSFETDPLGFQFHSFKRNSTTNIMDYLGEGNSGKKLYHLWYWQIRKIRKEINSY